MNNEEKILALLEGMDKRLEKLEAGQAKLETDVSTLSAGQAKLADDVSILRAEMNDRFDSVDYSIEQLWKDLGHAEDPLDLHDTAIKKIM